MTANNSLTAGCFSVFYSHSFGYEKKKANRPDYQAVIFVYQPNS